MEPEDHSGQVKRFAVSWKKASVSVQWHCALLLLNEWKTVGHHMSGS